MHIPQRKKETLVSKKKRSQVRYRWCLCTMHYSCYSASWLLALPITLAREASIHPPVPLHPCITTTYTTVVYYNILLYRHFNNPTIFTSSLTWKKKISILFYNCPNYFLPEAHWNTAYRSTKKKSMNERTASKIALVLCTIYIVLIVLSLSTLNHYHHPFQFIHILKTFFFSSNQIIRLSYHIISYRIEHSIIIINAHPYTILSCPSIYSIQMKWDIFKISARSQKTWLHSCLYHCSRTWILSPCFLIKKPNTLSWHRRNRNTYTKKKQRNT